jgi:hypothetical protein
MNYECDEIGRFSISEQPGLAERQELTVLNESSRAFLLTLRANTE